ncbi:hypothetical protein NEMIN01_1000 [Nematocida minor]|uniref:uncharacterized protein n=1 Tax=Nematocida minor TaxID=1912983 RepID=UPI00221F3756|nr:uncharacterized protein NEMIN01_1000 [Nematocida minor]KAI5190376.1 hypothetical protein NEMIN01_1000 [Nematocida minor]
MVLKHIKSMLGIEHLEVAGNLYCNKAIKIKDATITIADSKLVVEGESKSEFIFSDISYIDFSKTESNEVSVYFLTNSKNKTESKWIFVFRQNIPRTIVQFYGKIFPHQPKINGWTVLFTNDSVSLKKYNQNTEVYDLVDSSVSVRMIKIEESVFIRVYKEYEILRKGDLIQDYSNFYVDQETNSFSWHLSSDTHGLEVYRLIFSSLPVLFSFISSFVSATTEEAAYVEKMEIDNYMDCEISEESEESEEESEESSDERVLNSKISDRKVLNKKTANGKKSSGNIFGGRDKVKNKALAVSTDNTFISRGNAIGVFQNNPDDLAFVSTLSANLKNNQEIVPDKMIATNGNLIMTDSNNPQVIHKLDMNSGKVADSWDTSNEIRDFFSYKSDSNELLGISSNKLFKIDPRCSSVISGKEYASNTKFRSGDATKNGYFAIGSDSGDIRLYDSIDKRAKTLLPGLGDAVMGVFISPSGKYLVGTCKTYLMLVITENESVSGFKTSLGQKKPVPKKLIVRPEHLHYFGGAVNFTNASISTDKDEKYVIVSTGEWVIVWDMAKVLKGDVFSYQIKKNEHCVVSNSFIPGDSDKIIVAMDDEMAMVSRQTLKKAKKPSK